VTDTWRFVPESVWNDIEDGLVSNAVNIEDYGAVADSTGATGNGTDNTTAIAAAITAASTRGCPIYVPPRPLAFRFTDQLVMNHNGCGIVGSGWLYADSLQNEPMVQIYRWNGVQETVLGLKLMDFRMTGRTTFSTTGHLFNITQCLAPVIERVRLEDANCMALVVTGSTDFTVRDVYVSGAKADGIHLYGCARATIEGCHVRDTGDDAIAVSSDFGQNFDITIRGNTVFQTGSRGIAVLGGTTILVEGNTIWYTWQAGIIVRAEAGFGAVTGVSIKGNTIIGGGKYTTPPYARGTGSPCGINITGSASFNCSGVVVEGNLMYDSRNNGIVVGDGTASRTLDVDILNNIIEHQGSVGGAGNAAAGGGVHSDAPGSVYANVYINGLTRGSIRGNNLRQSYHQAIWGKVCSGFFRITDNECYDTNVGARANTPAIDWDQGTPVICQNTVEDPNNRITVGIDKTGSTNPVVANNALGSETIV
jgi:hypothetical protein